MTAPVVVLSDDQLGRLADLVADRVADQLADREQPTPALVDAATLARELAVSRQLIYERADELGAVRIGNGSRPRLRFDVDRARAALQGERTPPEPPPPPTPRRRRARRATGTPVLRSRPVGQVPS